MTQLLVDGEVPLLATGVRHRMHAARNLTVEVVDLIHGVHGLVSEAADLIDEVLDLWCATSRTRSETSLMRPGTSF